MSRLVRAALGVLAILILPSGQPIAAPSENSVPVPGMWSVHVCVPRGVPPFAEWHAVGVMPIFVQDEWGRPVAVIKVKYESQGQVFLAFWDYSRRLLSVDPAPENPKEPGWWDRGMVTPQTRVRIEPTQACDWFRPFPISLPEEFRP